MSSVSPISGRKEDSDQADLSKKSNIAVHLVVGAVCFFILVGAFVLSPADADTSQLRIGRFPIPQTCAFKNLTGLSCPGCGLSRSLVAATHNDVGGSFTFHRLGPLTLVYIFIQFIYRLGMIVIPKIWNRLFGSARILNLGIIGLGILFAANWIYTLFLEIKF